MAANFDENYSQALKGDKYAMWCVGYALITGEGAEKNIEEGEKWYKKLVDLEDEDAALDYASILFYGYNILPRNADKALEIATHFASKGSAKAQEFLALLYEDDSLNDIEKSLYWRQKAVRQNYPDAIIRLGQMYEFGVGVNKDLHKSLSLVKSLADQGNKTACFCTGQIYQKLNDLANSYKYYLSASDEVSNAQYILGTWYLDGEYYVQQDVNKAIEWFSKAANDNHVKAQAALGYCYSTNNYGIPNGELAAMWYEKALDNQFYDVLQNLGNLYFNGDVIPRDINKALEYYTKSAEMGYVESQSWLAQIYDDGINGVTKNPEKAFYWTRIAAEKNHSLYNNLGLYYIDGVGTAKNIELGIEYIKKSAQNGDVNSQYNLGNFYRQGQYVKRDDQEAVFWYKSAASQGDLMSKKILESYYGISQN